MSKAKKKGINKNFIFIGLGVFALIVFFSLTIYYQIRINSYNDNKKEMIMYVNNETITVSSSLPMDDELAKTIVDNKQGYFKMVEFEVVNVTPSLGTYQIYIKKNNLGLNEINNHYVKFYLTDSNDYPVGIYDANNVPTYNKLNIIKEKPDYKLLYSEKLDGYANKKFKLRVWVADNYRSESEDFFSFDIGVRPV